MYASMAPVPNTHTDHCLQCYLQAKFKAGKMKEAIQAYTAAASFASQRLPWEPNNLMREELSTMLSNRSAAYLAEKDVISALADAEVVTQIKKPWGKGHYRKARAFLLMGRFEEAREAVQLGLSLEPANTVCALELVRIAFTNFVLACIRNSAIF